MTGGIYFGPSETHGTGDEETASQSMVYSAGEVKRIVRLAAEAARGRGNRLTSVDKANVLEPSRLWRRTAAAVMAQEFPDVHYDVVLVDAMAMHLINRPADFDVVVTGNLFGDILTDAASMLPGSLGLLPSASIGSSGPGLYEPIHGSAPDLAGQGVANPLATILAAAMLFRHSLGRDDVAEAIESAVGRTLADGLRTADLARGGGEVLGTEAMTDAVMSVWGPVGGFDRHDDLRAAGQRPGGARRGHRGGGLPAAIARGVVGPHPARPAARQAAGLVDHGGAVRHGAVGSPAGHHPAFCPRLVLGPARIPVDDADAAGRSSHAVLDVLCLHPAALRVDHDGVAVLSILQHHDPGLREPVHPDAGGDRGGHQTLPGTLRQDPGRAVGVRLFALPRPRAIGFAIGANRGAAVGGQQRQPADLFLC